ncbi:hypothetical protein [Pantoea stewartii]|uniref:Chaperonin n=1 Tax=Pantoea stewartii subsp. stewartii DC283 TaxID=660596 RepID=A0ABM6KBJ8_PANSE|nr:hypothetical protein [Pantoea stewartii]ARF52075.1 chaperonin [Pantoea stewartii subsp. stewartii DC283]
MKNKKSLFDVASTVGNDALLQVAEQQPAATTRAVRTKTLKAIPETFFAAHKTLRDTNKTNLDFSNYIMEALREKLERDGAI